MQEVLHNGGGASLLAMQIGSAETGGSVQAADYALATCDLSDAEAVQALLKHTGLDST